MSQRARPDPLDLLGKLQNEDGSTDAASRLSAPAEANHSGGSVAMPLSTRTDKGSLRFYATAPERKWLNRFAEDLGFRSTEQFLVWSTNQGILNSNAPEDKLRLIYQDPSEIPEHLGGKRKVGPDFT